MNEPCALDNPYGDNLDMYTLWLRCRISGADETILAALNNLDNLYPGDKPTHYPVIQRVWQEARNRWKAEFKRRINRAIELIPEKEGENAELVKLCYNVITHVQCEFPSGKT